MDGLDAEGVFPVILGHEGAGIVESVGEGVTKFKAGDHVLPLYIPQCYECAFCKSPKTNLCQKIRLTQGRGVMPNGTTRFTCKGQSLFHYMGISSFAEYTVVADISLAKVIYTHITDTFMEFQCPSLITDRRKSSLGQSMLAGLWNSDWIRCRLEYRQC